MAALNTVGFSESFISLLQTHGVKIVDGAQNDNRIISCLTIIILQSIIVIGYGIKNLCPLKSTNVLV